VYWNWAFENDLTIFARRKILKSGIDVIITIFCDFCQFSTNNLAFFSKANATITFSAKLLFVWVKNANVFAKLFGEIFFENHNIGPRFRKKLKHVQQSQTVRPLSGPRQRSCRKQFPRICERLRNRLSNKTADAKKFVSRKFKVSVSAISPSCRQAIAKSFIKQDSCCCDSPRKKMFCGNFKFPRFSRSVELGRQLKW
jgi:hypothetical protein